MTMTNCKFSVLLTSLLLSLVACTVVGEGPQSIAKEAFEQWSEEAGTPYEDVTYETLSDDGTFATVRVTAFFAESPEAGWREMQADVQCRKVAGKWRCDEYFYFTLSEAEQQRIVDERNATATAMMATQVVGQATATADYEAAIATATAEYERMVSATETAWADATATTVAAIPTETAQAIERQASPLYENAIDAYESGDYWLAGFYLQQVVSLDPDYHDASSLLAELEPGLGHIVFSYGDVIYIMPAIGGALEEIESGYNAALSRDGTMLAFRRGSYIRAGPLRGDHPPVIDFEHWDHYDELGNLDWSPDNRSIAVAVYMHELEGLWIYDMATDEFRRLLPDTGYPYPHWVEWAPDGSRLCFTLGRTIHVINSDGTGDTVVHDTGDPDWTAHRCSWSPDGESIVIGAIGGGYEMYIMNSDGSGATRLRDPNGYPIRGACPTWSLDGNRILYYDRDSDELVAVTLNGASRVSILSNVERTRCAFGGL